MAGAAFAPISTAPPWDWNPIGVGIAAFNDVRRTKLMQQEEQRRQEESALNNAIKRETLPYAATAAQLELEKLRAQITASQAAASESLATAEYRRSLAQGSLEGDDDFSGLYPDQFRDLFGPGSIAPKATPGQATKQAAPISDDARRMAPQDMLDRSGPVSLSEPTSAAAGNPLLRTFADAPRSNVLDNFGADLDLTELAPVGSDASVQDVSQPISDFEKAEVMSSASRTLSQNPLTNFQPPYTGGDAKSFASQPDAETEAPQGPSDLRRFLQADKDLERNINAAVYNSSRKEAPRIQGKYRTTQKRILDEAATRFGLGPQEYDALRKFDDDSLNLYDELSRTSQGAYTPAQLVGAVQKRNAEKTEEAFAALLGKPKSGPDPEKLLDLGKKRVEALTTAAAATDDLVEKEFLNREITRLNREVSGAPTMTARDYVGIWSEKRATAPDDDTRSQLDKSFNLPNDDTVLDIDRFDNDARARKVDEATLPALRAAAMKAARDSGRPVISRGRQGISIFAPEDLTDESIGAMTGSANPVKPAPEAAPSADAPVLARVAYAIDRERVTSEEARAQKEKDMQTKRAPYEAAQEQRSAEIEEFDALYDSLVSRGGIPGQREIGGILGIETTGPNRAVDPALFDEAVTRMEQILKRLPAKDRWRASSQSRLDRVKALRPGS